MNNFSKFITSLAIISVAFVSCSNTIKKDGETNSSGVKKTKDAVSIDRFDEQVYQYLQNPTKEKEDSLNAQYSDLLQALSLSIANASMETDSTQVFEVLRVYFAHPMLMRIYKDALDTSTNNLSGYESKLSKAKQQAEDYLPKYQMPKFAMHVSGFKENVIVLDDVISLSTERYLGTDYKQYAQFFEPYQIQQMAPEFVVRDYLTAWLMSSVVSQNGNEKPTLLSAIVNEGKTKYILSLLLPGDNVENIMGYNQSQIDWCKNNEKEVWGNILKQNQLFTTDYIVISKYIHDAPFTAPVGRQSPGRMGAWLGWQIVNEYMAKSSVSVDELLRANAKDILKISKFDPN